MLPPIANYVGRRQAWVKHYFLGNYIERLTFKVASKYDDFVYVDGFSGPWQTVGERFEDSSFGIALAALRKAKDEWKRIRHRDVRMTALLVEEEDEAFERLQAVKALYPDIRVETFNGDFTKLIPKIIQAIPRNAFTFALMDPKGFAIGLNAVAPLLSRPRTEVVFNFMFDFINRFALHSDPGIIADLEGLMPGSGWRERLAAISATADKDAIPTLRKAALVDSFVESMKRVGGYPHVLETPVYYPLRDRTFYSLVYATRSPIGVEVFRDCEVATLKEQDDRRAEAKVADIEQRSGQAEMFGQRSEMSARPSDAILLDGEAAARSMILNVTPVRPDSILFKDLRLEVMSQIVIRKTRVGEIAAELKKDGRLSFPNWEPRRRVPQDDYLVHR